MLDLRITQDHTGTGPGLKIVTGPGLEIQNQTGPGPGDPVAHWLARRIADREVSDSNPAGHSEKCHRGAMGQGSVLTNFTSSTEMRHPPALPFPTLKFGHGQYFDIVV